MPLFLLMRSTIKHMELFKAVAIVGIVHDAERCELNMNIGGL
jgi:hypothetical protein